MFVDRVQFLASAGKGGDGCVSFRREKYVPLGGPDGGDGGDGGSIILVAQHGVNSLVDVSHTKHVRARSGQNGMGANCHGRNAADIVIKVPPGTIVYDDRGGFVMKDLSAAGDQVVAARGGKGGKGNSRFKSSTNRAPREFTPGTPGEERRLTLELQVIADVGLIGKPNAGKSTLLSRMSRARPEIADYPFTTKFPNLGIVSIDQDRQFVMADIPGLIEGASQGVGLGHEFLRHVRRTRVLVHLVEPDAADGSDAVSNYHTIRNELAAYDASLADRPEILAVTKADLPASQAAAELLSEDLGHDVLVISAVTGEGLNELTRRIAAALAESDDGSVDS
ncbi:MAG: GTPase ObgE [Pirellulales bacterium]|nr:GTPase ObgE [Pirellulales bacterium]